MPVRVPVSTLPAAVAPAPCVPPQTTVEAHTSVPTDVAVPHGLPQATVEAATASTVHEHAARGYTSTSLDACSGSSLNISAVHEDCLCFQNTVNISKSFNLPGPQPRKCIGSDGPEQAGWRLQGCQANGPISAPEASIQLDGCDRTTAKAAGGWRCRELCNPAAAAGENGTLHRLVEQTDPVQKLWQPGRGYGVDRIYGLRGHLVILYNFHAACLRRRRFRILVRRRARLQGPHRPHRQQQHQCTQCQSCHHSLLPCQCQCFRCQQRSLHLPCRCQWSLRLPCQCQGSRCLLCLRLPCQCPQCPRRLTWWHRLLCQLLQCSQCHQQSLRLPCQCQCPMCLRCQQHSPLLQCQCPRCLPCQRCLLCHHTPCRFRASVSARDAYCATSTPCSFCASTPCSFRASISARDAYCATSTLCSFRASVVPEMPTAPPALPAASASARDAYCATSTPCSFRASHQHSMQQLPCQRQCRRYQLCHQHSLHQLPCQRQCPRYQLCHKHSLHQLPCQCRQWPRCPPLLPCKACQCCQCLPCNQHSPQLPWEKCLACHRCHLLQPRYRACKFLPALICRRPLLPWTHATSRCGHAQARPT